MLRVLTWKLFLYIMPTKSNLYKAHITKEACSNRERKVLSIIRHITAYARRSGTSYPSKAQKTIIGEALSSRCTSYNVHKLMPK